MSDHAHEHTPAYYIKIYFILMGLFIISVCGPMLEIKILTLLTAFGIAVVKALMVAAYFMHLNIERRYIWYMLYTMLIFVFLFFIGVAPDVMNTTGSNWENKASLQMIEDHKGTKEGDDHGAEEPH